MIGKLAQYLRRHGGDVRADLGGVLAPAIDQDAGMVFRAGFGPFGFGMAKQQKAAHGVGYGGGAVDDKASISNLRQFSMRAAAAAAPRQWNDWDR